MVVSCLGFVEAVRTARRREGAAESESESQKSWQFGARTKPSSWGHRATGRAAHAASILMGLGIEDSGYALATGLLLVICLLCICCVVIELRTCRALNEEERARRRSMRYTGITSGDRSQPIELIGSRPEDERPAGVDWSISMWALERGKYAKGDRGFRA